MNGKVKKVAGFLTCKDAFTQRNVTSIALVGVFFLVYILAGGKITTKLPRPGEIGGLSPNNSAKQEVAERSVLEEIEGAETAPDLTKQESEGVLGVVPSEDRSKRDAARAKLGSLFTDEERSQGEAEAINKEGLIKGADFTNRREQFMLEQSEKKPSDSLSAIEDRLKIRKKH